MPQNLDLDSKFSKTEFFDHYKCVEHAGSRLDLHTSQWRQSSVTSPAGSNSLEAGSGARLSPFCQNQRTCEFQCLDGLRSARWIVMDSRDARQPLGIVSVVLPPLSNHFRLRSIRPRDTLPFSVSFFAELSEIQMVRCGTEWRAVFMAGENAPRSAFFRFAGCDRTL